MLPVILVAVGAYLIGDSVLGDKKSYADGGELEKYVVEKDKDGSYRILNTEKGMYVDQTFKTKSSAESWKKEKDSQRERFGKESYFDKGGEVIFYEGQSVIYPSVIDKKMDKSVRDVHNKFANKELVIDKITVDKPFNTAKVFDRNTGEKAPFDLILDSKYVEQYAKGGKLVGKQKNLDVNKNGKLDAEDFKMLRGEKMTDGGLVVNSDEDLREIAKYMATMIKKKRWDFKDLVYYFEKENNYDYKYRVKIWDEMNVYEMKKTEENIYKVLKAIVEANKSKK